MQAQIEYNLCNYFYSLYYLPLYLKMLNYFKIISITLKSCDHLRHLLQHVYSVYLP